MDKGRGREWSPVDVAVLVLVCAIVSVAMAVFGYSDRPAPKGCTLDEARIRDVFGNNWCMNGRRERP